MNSVLSVLLVTTLTSLVLNAMADTSPSFAEASPSELVQFSDVPDHPSANWTGMGRLRNTKGAYCTATLIDTRNTAADADTAPAYVITSQRCLNTDSTGTYAYFGGIQRNIHTVGVVHFNHFENRLGHTQSYALKKIAWQSDYNLGIAIIELKKPLSDLIKAGIHPLKIAAVTPPSGTEIRAFGIPEKSHLSVSQCTQLPAVAIASFTRVNAHVLPNQCADLTAGGRGGPVLDKASNALISVTVASTYGMSSHEKCLDLAPCELSNGASHWSANTHYSVPVSFINNCFSYGMFTLNTHTCGLKDLASVRVNKGQHLPVRILEKITADTQAAPDTFTVSLTVKAAFYRYKYAHSVNACQTAEQYSVEKKADKAFIDITLDNTVGMHLLCIIGVASTDKKLTEAQLSNAKIIAIERYASTAQIAPKNVITRESPNSDDYRVAFKHISPFVEHITYKYGRYDQIDCADPNGYVSVFPADYHGHRLSPGDHYPDLIGVELPEFSSLSIPSSNPTGAQWFGQTMRVTINAKEHAIKLCMISHNREKVAAAVQTYLFRPL